MSNQHTTGSHGTKLLAGTLAAGMLVSGLTTTGIAMADEPTSGDQTSTSQQDAARTAYETMNANRVVVSKLLDANNANKSYTAANWQSVQPQLQAAYHQAQSLTEISDPTAIDHANVALADALNKLTDKDEITITYADGSSATYPRATWNTADITAKSVPQTITWGEYPDDTSNPHLGATAQFTSDASKATFTQGDSKLGVGTTTNTYRGDGDFTRITVVATVPSGSEVTSKDGAYTFTNTDGAWTMTVPMELSASDQLPETQITMSDGSSVTIPSNLTPKTVTRDGTQYKTVSASIDGKTTAGTPYTVNITGTRAYDTALSLSVTRTPAEGDPTTLPVSDAQKIKAEQLQESYKLDPLDADAVGDQYTLNINPENEKDITIGEVKATLGDNGTRILTTTVGYTDADGNQQSKQVSVTVPFDAAKKTVGNPDAALEGFDVNGQRMDWFDPDVLNYTITAKADEKTTVTPIAKEGQTVKAGDIKQTAWTTVQSWAVEKDGQTRTYTVTLVREHDPDQATADDKFTPSEAIIQPATSEADSPTDTTLASHGYVLDGKYVPVEDDDYQIPEGGTFSYEPKVGQVVRAGVEKVGGMTYRYRMGVLAPDGKTYKETGFMVTYITEATNRAELTGIKVDGEAIKDFSPDKTEYTVDVKNPEQWTVSPQFDKATGMSVSTHKDGQAATITVYSADNLNSRTYTVHVKQKMKLIEQVEETLANTGVGMLVAGICAAALIVAGAVAGIFASRRKKRVGMAADEQPADSPQPDSGDSKSTGDHSDPRQ